MIGVFDGFSIMTSFFVEFAHTRNGFECSDVNGFMHLLTAQECQDAEEYAKSFNSNARYEGVLDSGSHPKGCIIADWGRMWFNRDPTGRRESRYKNICRTGNT